MAYRSFFYFECGFYSAEVSICIAQYIDLPLHTGRVYSTQILNNWDLKKKLRTFKIILCHKCICQMLPYLATAESWAPWLIWLFAVIYSQQMRELNPNQTHAQLPHPAPRSLCSVCSFQPASDVICWSLMSMSALCVSNHCLCIWRIPVISFSVAKWGNKVIFLEVLLTSPRLLYSFPSCSYQFSSFLE